MCVETGCFDLPFGRRWTGFCESGDHSVRSMYHAPATLVAASLIGLLGLFHSPQDDLLANLAWLQLSKGISSRSAPALLSALDHFEKGYGSARGLAMAYLWLGNDETAIRTWQQLGNDTPATLGSTYRLEEHWNQALTLYRGASSVEETGAICQLMYATPELLSPSNQEYCRSRFADGNLYLENQRQYQRLSLNPGTMVQFRASIRVDQATSHVRPLYIQWNSGGKSAGNSAPVITDSTEGWVSLEREFTLPANADDSTVFFYPVLQEGEATVQVQDVHIEIIK